MVYKSKSKIEIVFSRLALHTAFVVVVVIVAAIVGIICIIFFIIFTADVHFESVLNGGPKKALGKHSPNCRGDKWLNTSYTHTHNDRQSYLYHLHIALIQVRFGVFVCRWAWPGKRLCHGACQRHSHALYVSFAIDIFDYLSLKVDKSPRAKPAKGFCLSLSPSLRSISISPLMMIAQFAQ